FPIDWADCVAGDRGSTVVTDSRNASDGLQKRARAIEQRARGGRRTAVVVMKTWMAILLLGASVFSVRAQNVVVAGALTYGPTAVPTGPSPSMQGAALSSPSPRVVYRAATTPLTIGSSFRPRRNLYAGCFT